MPAKVWGNDFDALEWIDVSGLPVSGAQVTPPDPHIDAGFSFPGGSDGISHYLLVVDDVGPDGPLYVDKFDASMSTLLDRWLIPDWHFFTTSGKVVNLEYSFQHVSASSSRVVAIMDLLDYDDIDPVTGGEKHYIGVAVFDTTGTLLDQYLIYTTVADGMGNVTEGGLAGSTGSFCDGVNVYFWNLYLEAGGEDNQVAKVELASGTLTALFNRVGIGALSPGADPFWIDARGLVAADDTGTGDLICVSDSIARVGQDGTPVWFTANPDSGDVAFYSSLARSGRNSVWAGAPSEDYGASASPIAHEFGFDGVYRKASAFNPEPVYHTWLIGQGPFEYHWRWPSFGKVVADAGRH